MTKTAELYRIKYSTVTCGILVRDHRVIAGAPIMRWAIGKTLREILTWIGKKGGAIDWVKSVEVGQETEVGWVTNIR